MDYKRVHDSIIARAKGSNREKGGTIYYEAHHIIPACLGGEGNSKDWKTHPNIVLLTAREHYVIHRLLTRIYPNENKLKWAFVQMCVSKNKYHERDIKINSREYQEAREYSKMLRLQNPLARKNKKVVYDTWTGKYYEGIREARKHISKEHLKYGIESGRLLLLEKLPEGKTFSQDRIQIPKRAILDHRFKTIFTVSEWRKRFGNGYAIEKHMTNGNINYVWIRN